MARPTNRYARAQARARYRKPKRTGSSLGWNLAIGVIVILGIGGIVVSRTGSGTSGGAGLEIGDHWHAALGVNICGEWEPAQPEFTSQFDNPSLYAGIHTHDDGIIHMEPQSSADTGANATVGNFAEFGGWDLGSDSFETWTGKAQRNGDTCPDGQAGTVRWAVNGKEREGDPGDLAPGDGDVVVIAFIPDSVNIEELVPPSTAELPNAAQNE
jgi:hypothetical protein